MAGSSPVELKRGMDKAMNEVVAEIKKIAMPVQSLQDVESIATVSANNDVKIGLELFQSIFS